MTVAEARRQNVSDARACVFERFVSAIGGKRFGARATHSSTQSIGDGRRTDDGVRRSREMVRDMTGASREGEGGGGGGGGGRGRRRAREGERVSTTTEDVSRMICDEKDEGEE